MRYRTLGRTDLRVSEIGFGAWGIGRQLWKGGDDVESAQALETAVERGINFFDTALVYGDGHSEELIGRLLAESEQPIQVATKVPPMNMKWPAQGALAEAFPAHHVSECVEASLKNLGADRVDLVQLHVWDPSWIEDLQWHEELCRLRDQGKVGHIGVSINDHDPDSALELVDSGLIDSVQVIYNIFDQSPQERLFPLCSRRNVGVIARVPLDEGALTGNVTPETRFSRRDWRSRYFRDDRKQQVWERLQGLMQETGVSREELPSLALRFCLHRPEVSCVIPGMRRPRHVDGNAEASESSPLSAQTLEVLSRFRWDRNFYQ